MDIETKMFVQMADSNILRFFKQQETKNIS